MQLDLKESVASLSVNRAASERMQLGMTLQIEQQEEVVW